MAALIDNILDLAMIEAGRLELSPTRFDLTPFMESVASLAREQARPKQIAVTVACPPDIGDIVADERRLKQEIEHPLFGYRCAYRRIFELEARLLARYLLGEIPEYPGFRTR